MLNIITLVGRISNQDKDKEITLACPRNEKNEEGIYETDFINVKLQGSIWESVSEYCRVGDMIGVKGRLETLDNQLIVKAEKVSFLSTKSNDLD